MYELVAYLQSVSSHSIRFPPLAKHALKVAIQAKRVNTIFKENLPHYLE